MVALGSSQFFPVRGPAEEGALVADGRAMGGERGAFEMGWLGVKN